MEESETRSSGDESNFVDFVDLSKKTKQTLFYTSVFSLINKNRKSSPRFKAEVKNEPVILMGDTAATCSCINYKTYLQKSKKPLNLLKTNSKIFNFGNKENIKAIGKIDYDVEGNNN